jgi:glycine oxidase
MSEQQNNDVVIIGGGVIGCSIAYNLRKAGVEVVVIERQEVAAEASSAAAGLLSPLGALTGPGPFTDLVLASWSLAPTLMAALEEESGIEVEYRQIGSLHVATQASEVTVLRQQMVAWEALGAAVTWLTGDEVREREPLLGAGVKAAISVQKEGSIRAPSVTRAYAEAARRLGARFLLSTEVTEIVRDGARAIGVRTAQGTTIGCQRLVIAGGAWSARCGEWLGLTIPVSPMRGQILALKQPQSPLQHIVFDEDIYFVPKVDGTIYVGATVEQVGFDKSLTAGGIAWLLACALRLAPSLEHASIAQMWAGLRPWSSDRRPILGTVPDWENVILATGHSGMGFELSTITGKMIAELITTGRTPELIRTFGIERFMQ